MTNEIHEIWCEIENWVKNEEHTNLNPPMKPDEIKMLESKTGLKLPSDLIESLAIHNGSSYLQPCEGTFNSAKNIIETIANQKETMLEIFGDTEEDIDTLEVDYRIQRTYWSDSWIPFFYTDWSNICIDLNPSREGIIGQIIEIEMETLDINYITDSYLSFLRQCLMKIKNYI